MGPFPWGDWPDINCFRWRIKGQLEPGERVEADDGYIGEDPRTVKAPGSMVHVQEDWLLCVRSTVRRRHETVNKRLKQFKCLATVFKHDIAFHGQCFRSVTVLTQLAINHGMRLFSVDGYQDP